jgi:hypothetical protein
LVTVSRRSIGPAQERLHPTVTINRIRTDRPPAAASLSMGA